MFVFNNLLEMGEWLDKHATDLQVKANSEKGMKKHRTQGQVIELRNIAALIKGNCIVIKEPEPPKPTEPQKIYAQQVKEEPKQERPSGANNDFLRWVRDNYGPKIYQRACKDVEDGVSEEQIRRVLGVLQI